MTERTYKQKHELIQRISDVTDIRSDVVQDVLDGLVSVAMEEICSNDGHFRIPDLLTISPESVKGYQTKLSTIPPHKRLRPKLSSIPKIMYKIQQDQFADEPDIITAENWRDVFEHYKSLENGSHSYTFSNAKKIAGKLDGEIKETAQRETPASEQPAPFRAPTIKPRQQSKPPRAPEAPQPAQNAPKRPPSQNTPPVQRPPVQEPYNPFLDDDDDEY